jgi:GrpB-like predicted nucleotidyltransferase (UPF0157 family)
VHVCNSGGDWGRDELLFRDYLAANSVARDEYAALKRNLTTRWHDDRQAYGEAKTAFILDALEDARSLAGGQGWNPLEALAAAILRVTSLGRYSFR